MKKFMKNAFNALSSSRMRGSRSVSVLIVGIAVTLLAACGGGGGGGSSVVTPPTPVPTTYTETITCPGGDKQTATADSPPAALTAAEKLCAKPTLLSQSPANGATNVDPKALVFVYSTSSSLRITDVKELLFGAGPTLLPNQTLIPVTVSTVSVGGVIDPKKISIKPTVALAFSQVYAYSFNLYDSIGNLLKVTGNVTTANVSCTAPQVPSSDGQSCVTVTSVCTAPAMTNSLGACVSPPAAFGYTWNSVIKVWVADIGTLVTGLNTLPAECVTVGDACWKASSASGAIKYFATNMTVNGNGRALVFAGFIVGKSGLTSGYFNMIPIYVDTESDTPVGNKDVGAGSTSGFLNAKGSQDGVKFTTPTEGCFEKFSNGAGIANRSATCPI